MTWLAVPDTYAAWLCLTIALLFLFQPVRQLSCRLMFDTPSLTFLLGIGLLAFGLSAVYLQTYLAGGPRIIDATAYLLQAKTLATGALSFAPPGALASFNGRFLLVTPIERLAGIFPPGFPLILALGVVLGVPLVINPLIGAALAVVTTLLGRRWFDDRTGRLAGVLSTLCVTLRYHSADTMSHAWSALLVLGTLLAASYPGHHPARGWLAGACAGWLYATRPLTGVVFAVAGALVLLHKSPRRARDALSFAGGLLPGLCIWGIYQWAATGEFSTTQSEYYARGDFPTGCFRLGFGREIGCRYEHGDFLDVYQPAGFGAAEAWAVTLRRLGLHHVDIANLPGFGCLGLASLQAVRRVPKLGLVLCLICAHVLSYALFYFDGNYPGGGARIFVDILPLQHVLLAWVLLRFRLPTLGVAAALAGFALCGSHLSRHLNERDGGRPMFEAHLLDRAGIDRGLIFIDTDHGFNLAFDPSHDSPATHRVFARYRGDASDATLWHKHGRPPTFRYRFDPGTRAAVPRVEPYTPAPDPVHAAAHFWPPSQVHGGSAIPTLAGACGIAPGLLLLPSDHTQLTRLAVPMPRFAPPFQTLVYSDGPIAAHGVTHTTRELYPGCYETRLQGSESPGDDWVLSITTEQQRVISGVRLVP